MTITVLLAIAALSISIVSAYFSIVGLAAIFAASVIPIIVMGTAVEFGKIVSVAWVHYFWHSISRRLKYIMVVPIAIAMILTSVGVFGFLSKAHVTQTSASDESVAQVLRIDKEVLRQKSIIDRGENKVRELESSGSNADDTIQVQIDNEQQRIDSATTRIQPAIDEQNAIIAEQTQLFRNQLLAVDKELALLQEYIDKGEIKKAQQLIGEKSKGGWGPKTAETARLWRLARTQKKDELYNKIENASQNNGAIIAARKEISRIRQSHESQLSESNKLINRLREKLGNAEATNVDEQIDEQFARISSANKEIEELTNKKYELEAEYRQLEAEVGPIKYIAEFVYDQEPDRGLLEKAVRWVIILLLLVLDPFAVILVIAATDGYKWYQKDNKKKEVNKTLADPDLVADLQDELANTLEEKDSLFRVIEERNKEMIQLREQTQSIVDSESEGHAQQENKLLEYEEVIRDMSDHSMKMSQEIMDLGNARDALQAQLDNPAIALSDEDAETIAELIEQRNELRVEFEQQRKLANQLAVKISNMEKEAINISDGKYDSLKLLQRNKELEDRISSMVKLADFDITSAQALVEASAEIQTLRQHLTSVTSQYNELKENIEKGT